MRPFITCDLDSTVCNTSHRYDLIDRENGTDWVQYSLACDQDEPFEAVVMMLRTLQQTTDIYYVSGRNVEALDKTIHWLKKHGLNPAGVALDPNPETNDALFKDYHVNYKADRIREVEHVRQSKVLFHIDDLPSVADHLRSVGIPCIVVDPMYTHSPKDHIV